VFSTSGSRVDTTIVDGQVVVRDGRLVTGDAGEIAREARRAVEALMERAGIAPAAPVESDP
jgi:hypothetical protein